MAKANLWLVFEALVSWEKEDEEWVVRSGDLPQLPALPEHSRHPWLEWG